MLAVYQSMKCSICRMKKSSPLLRPFTAAALSFMFCLPLHAEAAAEKIVNGVRQATTLQQNDLNGTLRKKGKRTPIGLFLRGKNIQFQYQKDKKWTVFHMRLNQKDFNLFEIINGKNVALPPNKLGQPILNTDLTYEDLAFRFLYWPNPKIVGEDVIKLQKCHKIRMENPGKGGRYGIVYIWVHQKYNALMKVAGYDKNGKLLKQFYVTELMKVANGQTLKKMKVESFNPANGKAVGITYLEFKKPTPVRKGLR